MLIKNYQFTIIFLKMATTPDAINIATLCTKSSVAGIDKTLKGSFSKVNLSSSVRSSLILIRFFRIFLMIINCLSSST